MRTEITDITNVTCKTNIYDGEMPLILCKLFSYKKKSDERCFLHIGLHYFYI